MKSFSLSSLLLIGFLLPATAFSQYQAGSVSLGGTVSLDGYDEGHQQRGSFTLAPSAGYSYTDRIQLGASVFYAFNYSDPTLPFEGEPMQFYNAYAMGPFWRYNYPIALHAGIYGSASPTLFYFDGSGDYKAWSLTLTAGAGAYYFFTRSISLEIGLGGISYSASRATYGNATRHSQNWGASLKTESLSLSGYYHF